MTRAATLAALTLLAACGQGGADFAVDIPLPAGLAQERLLALDGGAMSRAMSLPPVRSEIGEDGRVLFAFINAEGIEEGWLDIRLDSRSLDETRLEVTLDLPYKTYAFEDDQSLALSEERAEQLLQQALEDWAAGVEAEREEPLSDVNDAFFAFTLVLQPQIVTSLSAPQHMFAVFEPSPAQSASETPRPARARRPGESADDAGWGLGDASDLGETQWADEEQSDDWDEQAL